MRTPPHVRGVNPDERQPQPWVVLDPDEHVLAVPAGRRAVDPFLAVALPDDPHTHSNTVRTVVQASCNLRPAATTGS
jgi:hypothetical protein